MSDYKLSDSQLVKQAGEGHSEATVEMMRRLKKSNERLAIINVSLTLVLVLLTAAMVMAMFQR
jgi:hypothetical protein